MRHDLRATASAESPSDLYRDERAHVAETHRYILHRGQELIDLCGRAAGLAGEREAVAFREELLWVEGAAEGLLLATMARRLSGMTELTEDDRDLRDDLLCGLGRLATSAESLRRRKILAVDAGAKSRRHAGG
jgi:hypothetical protein